MRISKKICYILIFLSLNVKIGWTVAMFSVRSPEFVFVFVIQLYFFVFVIQLYFFVFDIHFIATATFLSISHDSAADSSTVNLVQALIPLNFPRASLNFQVHRHHSHLHYMEANLVYSHATLLSRLTNHGLSFPMLAAEDHHSHCHRCCQLHIATSRGGRDVVQNP